MNIGEELKTIPPVTRFLCLSLACVTIGSAAGYMEESRLRLEWASVLSKGEVRTFGFSIVTRVSELLSVE
jgi:hypothetical protein